MTKQELIDEITDFCLEYNLFNKFVKIDETKNKIDYQLNDIEFVESLINTILLKTRNLKNQNINRIKILLLELEHVRLDLEYAEKGVDNVLY
ncbi:MAG: hypothetical protein FWF92_02850 [Oscillospiraceae bacterium]|nr:hypothetical protein [Oscillospiraceae bacterium]